MITFSCSACQKKFSVNDELAGEKSKCPGCGQMVAIPAPVAALETAELPPAPSRQDDQTEALTQTPSSNPVATQGVGNPDASHNTRLTDFLAPPQSGDELGRLGKYRVLKILGHGGMGVVFEAEDPKLKRSVALKVMLPTLAASASAGKRFLREAQAMAAVEHDHIVRVYQVDEERGVPFLAMEFLKGESLDERLEREEKMPLPEVLRIGREIAAGLGAAHTMGLIHRDVKPANIWLEAPRGRVKILDFGLARAASQDSDLTQQGAIVGTPAYMAPEQGRGEAVDARCDLFSLGIVLYRMVSDQPPFQGRDIVSTLMAVALHEPPPPARLDPRIPPELSELVMRLLEKDPDRRPASAGVVVEMLQTLERKSARHREDREDTVTVPAAPAKPATAIPRSRRPPLVVAAVLLLGGLIAMGVFTLIRLSRGPGDYVIDTDDPDFSFRVSQGSVTLDDRKTNRKYALKVVRQDEATGEHEVAVVDVDSGLAFEAKTLTIKRGQIVRLGAWVRRKQGSAKVAPIPVDDAWVQQVTAMPPGKQVKAVVQKLREHNLGFDGELTHFIEGGVVAEVQFLTDHVMDISPVRALTGLRLLDCHGSISDDWRSGGQLVDLSPLKDMKLVSLNVWGTKVSDLSPLKGMPLTMLACGGTRVTDLSPLKGMKLKELHCQRTRVSDLSPVMDMKLETLDCWSTNVSDLAPVQGMPLTLLGCGRSRVTDLSPLKGMKLRELHCDDTKVSDLSPLENMKLVKLNCWNTKISDLSPLKGMPLTLLGCGRSRVTDLSPLKGMKLRELHCDFQPERDAEILRSLKSLERINGKPAKEFWAEVEANNP